MPDIDDVNYIALAKVKANFFSIDPSLVCAVCQHESSWNPFAVRFEPAFEEKYIKPTMSALPPTEEMLRAMSFGLMQIMGETARELGYTGKFLTGLCDPAYGLQYGCAKLHNCLVKTGGYVEKALLMYNGGSDPNYPLAVLQYQGKYK